MSKYEIIPAKKKYNKLRKNSKSVAGKGKQILIDTLEFIPDKVSSDEGDPIATFESRKRKYYILVKVTK